MTRLAAAFAASILLLLAQPGAAFDGIRLTLLGTGSTAQPSTGPGPGALVEAGDEVLLFDCGEGTLGRLKQTGVGLRDLTAVFLTSLDPVHVGGCAELLDARRRVAREQPLLLWGPAGTIDAIRGWTGAPGAAGPGDVYPYEISENIVYQTAEVRVTAFVADYPAQRQAFGYRVDHHRRAVALLGGTRYSENVALNARGVQVLVHEVAAADQEHSAANAAARQALANHTSPEEAGKVFRDARPYLAVYSHLQLYGVSEEEVVRRTRRFYRGALQIGRDLMIVEIQNEVQIRSAPSDGPRER